MVSDIQTSGLYLASSQRILILDDNENNRLGLRLFLRNITKSPELIETQHALAAVETLKTSQPFDILFISPHMIESSVSLYLLWLLRRLDHPPMIYLIAKNEEANSYLNHFIGAEGIIMLDDPPDAIKQKLRRIIRPLNRNKLS